MLGMSFEAATRNFFDREKVLKAMDRKTRQVLSRFGAFTRQRARTSLRYAKSPSSPGRPPHIHKSLRRTKTNKKGEQKVQMVSPLRDFTFFAYDDSQKAVVIGPAKLGDKIGDGAALPALEYGGRSEVRDAKTGGTREVTIQARPWMGPAFEAEKKASLPKLWADVPFK